jgi:mannose-6-phosphate isomerase-like protein (cupin superfamily)
MAEVKIGPFAMTTQRYHITRPDGLPGVECPCGTTRRAFLDHSDQKVSLHLVEVSADARSHYHKRLTEIYFILAGSGQMELDGAIHPVTAGDAILIEPGCRHRAIGKLTVMNIVVPAFDPHDEWFD